MNICRALVAAIILTTLSVPPTLASDTETEPSLKHVLTRLDALTDRIAKLDERIQRLERILIKRPGRVDENGIIRDEKGRPIGIWGIDAESSIVPKR